MDPNTINQALNLIDKSNNILLLTHAKADCDGLGAVLAAYIALQELGKNVTAVTNDPTPENLAFLPSMNIVQNSLASAKDFIISLDITKTPLSKIKYNLEDNKVNIIITPKSGAFAKEDVSFLQGGNKYDLIISFDAGNLEHLGPIYDQNSEVFFETPIINIDHHASNTDFGQVNMVDVVAASATEVLYRVLEAMEKKYNKKLLTEDVATLLLAGIITDTGSFQHANTSPKSMEVSAKLLDLGARQQEIIKNIYKTKKLSTLKLWGIVLSKVQVDPLHRMVWSTISKDDLQEAGAEPEESATIIDDLLSNAPGAEVIMLIKENAKEKYISVSMRSTTNAIDVGKISSEMGGGGHVRAAGYKKRNGKALDQVVSEILDRMRKYQSDRLNIHPETPQKEEIKEDKPQDNKPEQKEEKPLEKEQENKPKKSTYLEFKAPKEEPTKQGGQPKQKEEVKQEEQQGQKPKSKRKRRPRKRSQQNKQQEQNKVEQQPKQEGAKPEPKKETQQQEQQPKETIPPPPVIEQPKAVEPPKPEQKPPVPPTN